MAVFSGLSLVLAHGVFAQVALPDVVSTFVHEHEEVASSQPLLVQGGRTINTDQLKALKGQVIVVDVMAPGDKRGIYGDMRGIAGAFWLPTAGDRSSRKSNAGMESYLEKITAGDKTRAIVFYCTSARCGRSVGAAARAKDMGYSDTLWYRGGMASWMASGGATEVLGEAQ
jgi:PQQ-dependent catabolism-associated CXXCW motif protein